MCAKPGLELVCDICFSSAAKITCSHLLVNKLMDFSVNQYFLVDLGFPNCTQLRRLNSALSLLKTINTGGPQGCVFVPFVILCTQTTV